MKVDGNNTAYDSREHCNAIIHTATNTLITWCEHTIIPDSVTHIGEEKYGKRFALAEVFTPAGMDKPIGGYDDKFHKLLPELQDMFADD